MRWRRQKQTHTGQLDGGAADVAAPLGVPSPGLQLDEALEHCRRGRGASALVSAERGIIGYLRRFEGDEPFTIEMAHALSRHADVLHQFGDPDLAVASADLAIRTFMNRRDEINRNDTAKQLYVPAFVKAGLIAAEIHERFNRHSIATTARKLAMQPVPESVEIEVAPPVPLLAEMTLARAFDRIPPPAGGGRQPAVIGQIKSSVTRPATDCSFIRTSQRCDAEDALFVAGVFAQSATAVMEKDRAAGLRLGLEAHVLYAHESERQSPQMRYNMGEHGPPWARTLLLCSQVCQRQELPELALDLASWMGGVVNALTPFALVDAETRTLMRNCLTWHVELLPESGDAKAADNATQALRGLDRLSP
jgi:hypothetical protein